MLRLPFVSRDRLAATIDLYESHLQRERDHSAVLRSLLVDMTTKYHDLKKDGYVAQAPVSTPRSLKAIDPLEQAIIEKCGSNRTLRGMMLRQLSVDRLTMDDSEILQRIQQGDSVIDHGPVL